MDIVEELIWTIERKAQLIDEIERLRADLAAKRALADRLATGYRPEERSAALAAWRERRGK